MGSRMRRSAYLLLAGLLLPAPAAWPQGRVVTDSVRSPALAHNRLGDPATRRVLVYLPPSYGRSPGRRYPVLYFLHGFTSHPEEWVDGTYAGLDLRAAMDSLVAAGSEEFVVVMPDADDRLGGGFYTDSPVAGGWADFVVRDVVGYVDRHYRTLPDRAHRALAGHSMGGYGTLALGFAHPERFGLLYAMSPCCLTFAGELGPTSPTWAAAARAPTAQPANAPPRTAFVVALATALSPAPGRARGYGALPFEPDAAGALRARPNIVARWTARMPIGLAQRLAARVRQRRAPLPEIHLDYGAGDQVASVVPGAEALARTLDSLGIPHTDAIFAGGHVDRVRERVSEHLLPTVGRWLRRGE